MDKEFEQTFLQRRHADAQQVPCGSYEKIFNITNHQGNPNHSQILPDTY